MIGIVAIYRRKPSPPAAGAKPPPGGPCRRAPTDSEPAETGALGAGDLMDLLGVPRDLLGVGSPRSALA